MSAVLRAVVDLLWRNRKNRLAFWGFSVMTLLSAGALWMWLGVPLHVTVGLVLSLGVFGLWFAWVNSLVEFNAPTHAQLVPGNVEALRTHLQLGGVLATAAWGLSFSLCAGALQSHWFWLAWVVLVAVACAVRRVWLWLAMITAFVLVATLQPALLVLVMRGLSEGSPLTGGYALGTLGSAALAWPLLAAQIGTGNARHQRNCEQRANWLAASNLAQGHRPNGPYRPVLWRGFAMILTWPLALQRRSLQLGGGGSPISRLELGLWQGAAHPWVALVGSSYLALILLLIPPDFMGAAVGLLIAWIGLITGTARERSLARTLPEQGVLALLPSPPQEGGLTRALAWRGWAFGLATWLVLALAWFAVADGLRPEHRSASSGLLAVALVSVASRMQDWSPRAPQANALDGWTFTGLAALMLGYWIPLDTGWTLPLAAVTLTGLTLYRARQLQKATACLPAGRQAYSGNSV